MTFYRHWATFYPNFWSPWPSNNVPRFVSYSLVRCGEKLNRDGPRLSAMEQPRTGRSTGRRRTRGASDGVMRATSRSDVVKTIAISKPNALLRLVNRHRLVVNPFLLPLMLIVCHALSTA